MRCWLYQVLVHWPHLSLSHRMSSVFSVSWCVLCGVKVPRGGWNGLSVLIDVCGYNLAERSGRTGCIGRSEVFGWLRTRRICYSTEEFWLVSLYYWYIWFAGAAPKRDAVCPYGRNFYGYNLSRSTSLPPVAPQLWRAAHATVYSRHFFGKSKCSYSTYRVITLTLNCLLPKVNPVQLYWTLGLHCAVVRWQRQGVNKCKLCHILAVNSVADSIQYVCYRFFVFDFLCDNTRRTTSSPNSIQELPLRGDTSVGHSDAL